MIEGFGGRAVSVEMRDEVSTRFLIGAATSVFREDGDWVAGTEKIEGQVAGVV